MYMALIGMAIFAVPRGIAKAVTWLVMAAVGWFMAAVERVYADVSFTWNGSKLVVTSDADSDDIIVYVDDTTDQLYVWDSVNNPSLVTSDPSELQELEVSAGAGDDYISVEDINTANGVTAIFIPKLFGEDGADIIYGSIGKNDCIFGGSGNDSCGGRAGSDTIYGEGGDDSLVGDLDGEFGHDVIEGDVGNDTIYGGDGQDYLVGGDGADELYAGGDAVASDGYDDQLFHGDVADLGDPDGYTDFLGQVNVVDDGDVPWADRDPLGDNDDVQEY